MQKTLLFVKPFISQVPFAVAFVVSLNLPVCSSSYEEKNRDDAVVRALASRHVAWVFSPGQGIISGSSLLLVHVRRSRCDPKRI